jgi:hypothetical protein
MRATRRFRAIAQEAPGILLVFLYVIVIGLVVMALPWWGVIIWYGIGIYHGVRIARVTRVPEDDRRERFWLYTYAIIFMIGIWPIYLGACLLDAIRERR